MTDAGRPLRADALRNRERLIEVAKQAFTDSGAEVSLEEIARRAEVGIGTLYRHFPTREAVLEAVYRHEVERLAASAETLLGQYAPLEALREWMLLFVDYLATKKVIVPALAAMAGGTTTLYENSGNLIRGAIGTLLDRGKAARAIRPDIESADMMQALAGLAYNALTPGWRESALRLIDILIAGLVPISSR